MANIKSQKKRIKTNNAAHERNKAVKSNLKTTVRRVHEAVEAGDADKAAAAASHSNRELDKAVSKGALHKNQAANRKSSNSRAADSVK
ncbi:MAG: small subunit ribosomal protein S20 [Actinomycetes bacterium]